MNAAKSLRSGPLTLRHVIVNRVRSDEDSFQVLRVIMESPDGSPERNRGDLTADRLTSPRAEWDQMRVPVMGGSTIGPSNTTRYTTPAEQAPAMGATQNSQSCPIAQPPTSSAGPVLRA